MYVVNIAGLFETMYIRIDRDQLYEAMAKEKRQREKGKHNTQTETRI